MVRCAARPWPLCRCCGARYAAVWRWSCQLGTALAQKIPEQRAVAALFVLAIAADGQVGVVGKRGEQIEQVLRARRAHLAAIVAQVLSPAGVGPGLAKRPADPFLARRQLGKPQVVVIAPRVIGFAHAARRAPYRAHAQPPAAPARTA